MDDKCSIRNVDCPSALKIELHVPRRDIENIQERSADHHSSTYHGRRVGDEYGVMDRHIHIGTTGINSTALEVACPRPIGQRSQVRSIKVGEVPEQLQNNLMASTHSLTSAA